jgi:hypothetical protein
MTKDISLPGVSKETREQTDTLIVYTDYSAKVLCAKCKKWESVVKDSKQATLLQQFPSKAETWVCGKCYRKVEAPRRITQEEVRQEQIAYGQSWNLAVAIMVPLVDKAVDVKIENIEGKLKDDILEWQEWFYQRLIRK